MTKIELINISGKDITAAFYYTVPDADYCELAERNTMPKGQTLSQQEIVDFQAGRLYEHIKVYNVGGKTRVEVLSNIESDYIKEQDKAMKEYSKAYSKTLEWWDGVTWSVI